MFDGKENPLIVTPYEYGFHNVKLSGPRT